MYLGKLKSIHKNWIELASVDVHDINDSVSTKEIYVQKTHITGIRPNRKKCRIDRAKIVSISLFSDVNL